MATSKYLIAEQISNLLKGGDASASSSVELPVIIKLVEQLSNKYLKADYFNTHLAAGETIPDGLVIASYSKIPVEQYKGILSRAFLPAAPISLFKGMGVYSVKPYISNEALESNTLDLDGFNGVGSTNVVATWTAIPNATSYYLERATNSTFTENLTPLYEGALLTYNDQPLPNSTLYYYRVCGKANGYSNSDFATNQIVTPS